MLRLKTFHKFHTGIIWTYWVKPELWFRGRSKHISVGCQRVDIPNMFIPPGCCSNLVFVKGKFTIKTNKVCQVNQQSLFAVQQWKCWQPSLEYFKASSEASEGEVGGLLSSESAKIILFLYIKPYKCPFKVSASVMLLKAVLYTGS